METRQSRRCEKMKPKSKSKLRKQRRSTTLTEEIAQSQSKLETLAMLTSTLPKRGRPPKKTVKQLLSPSQSSSEPRQNFSLEALFQVTDSELANMSRQGLHSATGPISSPNVFGPMNSQVTQNADCEEGNGRNFSLEDTTSTDSPVPADNASTDADSRVGHKRKLPMKQNNSSGRHTCHYCGRACAKPSVLEKHIRAHTGERPYPCTACGISFKTKSNLYKHCKSQSHALKTGTTSLQGDTADKLMCDDADENDMEEGDFIKDNSALVNEDDKQKDACIDVHTDRVVVSRASISDSAAISNIAVLASTKKVMFSSIKTVKLIQGNLSTNQIQTVHINQPAPIPTQRAKITPRTPGQVTYRFPTYISLTQTTPIVYVADKKVCDVDVKSSADNIDQNESVSNLKPKVDMTDKRCFDVSSAPVTEAGVGDQKVVVDSILPVTSTSPNIDSLEERIKKLIRTNEAVIETPFPITKRPKRVNGQNNSSKSDDSALIDAPLVSNVTPCTTTLSNNNSTNQSDEQNSNSSNEPESTPKIKIQIVWNNGNVEEAKTNSLKQVPFQQEENTTEKGAKHDISQKIHTNINKEAVTVSEISIEAPIINTDCALNSKQSRNNVTIINQEHSHLSNLLKRKHRPQLRLNMDNETSISVNNISMEPNSVIPSYQKEECTADIGITQSQSNNCQKPLTANPLDPSSAWKMKLKGKILLRRSMSAERMLPQEQSNSNSSHFLGIYNSVSPLVSSVDTSPLLKRKCIKGYDSKQVITSMDHPLENSIPDNEEQLILLTSESRIPLAQPGVMPVQISGPINVGLQRRELPNTLQFMHGKDVGESTVALPTNRGLQVDTFPLAIHLKKCYTSVNTGDIESPENVHGSNKVEETCDNENEPTISTRLHKSQLLLLLLGHSFPSLHSASCHLTFCCIQRAQPMYVVQSANRRISMYSNWKVAPHNPNPEGLTSKMILSLYKSQKRASNASHPIYSTTSIAAENLTILTHSSYWNLHKQKTTQHPNTSVNLPLNLCSVQRIVDNNELYKPSKSKSTGGYKTKEIDHEYVRGRGRGRYVCQECGIRCKKPSMLKKHIRTHTDVRPYHCQHCSFSFKTKGNLTKHMKSKTHQKKCVEIGIAPVTMILDDCQIDRAALAHQIKLSQDFEIMGEDDSDEDDVFAEAWASSDEDEEMAEDLDVSLLNKNKMSDDVQGDKESGKIDSYKPESLCTIYGNLDVFKSVRPAMDDEIARSLLDLSKVNVAVDNIQEPITTKPHELLRHNTQVVATCGLAISSVCSDNSMIVSTNGCKSKDITLLHLENTPGENDLSHDVIMCSDVDRGMEPLNKTARTDDSTINNTHCTNNTTNTAKGGKWNSYANKIAALQTANEHDVTFNSRQSKTGSGFYPPHLRTPITPGDNHGPIIGQFLPSTNLHIDKIASDVENSVAGEDKSSNESPNSSSGQSENQNKVKVEYIQTAISENKKLLNHSLHAMSCHGDGINISIPRPAHSPPPVVHNLSMKGSAGSDCPGTSSSVQEGGMASSIHGNSQQVFYVTGDNRAPFEILPIPGRVHSDSLVGGKYICHICEKSFQKQHQLTLHKNIHFIEKPLRCEKCLLTFRNSIALEKHLTSDAHKKLIKNVKASLDNPRPFKCAYCDVAFRIHGHFAKHLRSKMHVLTLERHGIVPPGTLALIEQKDCKDFIDATDCQTSLQSIQNIVSSALADEGQGSESRIESSSLVYGPNCNMKT